MKVRALSICLFLTASGQLCGQVLSGLQLEIGISGANQVVNHTDATPSGAIGFGNHVRLSGSLAVGSINEVGGSYLTGGFPYGGYYSFALGYANGVFGDSSAAIGSYNYIAGSDYDYAGGKDSLIVGSMNSSRGSSSLIVGVNNYIEFANYSTWWAGSSSYTTGEMEGTALLGRGLTSLWSHCLIAGRYNIYLHLSQPPGVTPIFILGNGVDGNNLSNALEVYSNGKIIMPKRQGDILMGEFGN